MHKYKVMWWKCANVRTAGLYDEEQNRNLHAESVKSPKNFNAERVVSALEVNCGVV